MIISISKISNFFKNIVGLLNINEVTKSIRIVPRAIVDTINISDSINKLSSFFRNIIDTINAIIDIFRRHYIAEENLPSPISGGGGGGICPICPENITKLEEIRKERAINTTIEVIIWSLVSLFILATAIFTDNLRKKKKIRRGTQIIIFTLSASILGACALLFQNTVLGKHIEFDLTLIIISISLAFLLLLGIIINLFKKQ
jgi:hypothetical protein